MGKCSCKCIGHSEDEQTGEHSNELATLTLKLTTLEHENRDLSDKLLFSSHTLDDAERLKTAFENDYRRTLDLYKNSQSRCDKLESQISTLSDATNLQNQLQNTEHILSETLTLSSSQSTQLEMYKKSVISAQLKSQSLISQLNKLESEKEELMGVVSTLSGKVSELERIVRYLYYFTSTR
jgi:hypothetical protein